jgi:hypothetical protein
MLSNSENSIAMAHEVGSEWAWTTGFRHTTDQFLFTDLTPDGGAVVYGNDDFHVPFLLAFGPDGKVRWAKELRYPEQVDAVTVLPQGIVLTVGAGGATRLALVDFAGRLQGEWFDSACRNIQRIVAAPGGRVVVVSGRDVFLLH